MQLYRGIIPLLYTKEREEEWMNDIDARVQFAVEFGKKSRFLRHLFNTASEHHT
jgi:pyruvate kinase